MTREELALYVHELMFKAELGARTGKSFQDFFELVMQKHDSSFVLVKPMGKKGDWKADGFSTSTATVYQCYAPEKLTGKQAAKKAVEDFEGAKSSWKERMREWVLVWSSQGALPADAGAAIADLAAANPTLRISHLGREGLWKIVRELPIADRVAILGPAPELTDAPATTSAEIQVLMKHLGKRTADSGDGSDFDLTAIAEKLDRNKLSGAVLNIVKPATPVARIVGEYVSNLPEPAFSQSIALDLAEKYQELVSSISDPDEIFGSLVDYVWGDHRKIPKYYWAAAGIVTHYFELCEVFER